MRKTMDELSVSERGRIRRLAVERVGERDQIWCTLRHADGSRAVYATSLDTHVATSQLDLLRDAAKHDWPVFFHYEDLGKARYFHSVTVVCGS